MTYTPGLHVLAELQTNETALLHSSSAFRTFIDESIAFFGLEKVGEAYHDFPGGGFTAVVCLTESHLSIHSWPEYGKATFDVFLSNYRKDNDATTRALFNKTKAFFRADANNYHELKR